jgi:putative ABC transport system ATP-binding protein
MLQWKTGAEHASGRPDPDPVFAEPPDEPVQPAPAGTVQVLQCLLASAEPEPALSIAQPNHSPIHSVHPAVAPTVIALRGVSKSYSGANGSFSALTDIDLTIARGEFVAIAGSSGSGKSTLLNLLAGLDRPSTGEVIVDGQAVHNLNENTLARWRGRAIGIVFQFFQLIPTLTAAENVMLPMDFAGQWRSTERRSKALNLLDRLGVADHADKLPSTLSGGQQQRVALARALANAPAILLADEPTGNLDSRNAGTLLQLLAELAHEGQTVVMVTHDTGAMRRAKRVITLADGRIVDSRTTDNGLYNHA